MARSINHRELNKLASLTLSGIQLLHRMSWAVKGTPQFDEDLPGIWHAWHAAWWVHKNTGGLFITAVLVCEGHDRHGLEA